MPRARYPLAPLVSLRDAAVDAKAEELARAVADEARARTAEDDANAATGRALDAAARVRDAEARALEAGELRVADLAQAGAWQVAAAMEEARLREAERDAARKTALAERVSEAGRTALAGARADAKVALEDRTRWTVAVTKREEAKAEEDAAEAWRKKA